MGGCLLLYKVDDKDKMHIIQFTTENCWMSEIGSCHSRKLSELSIDALENTIVLQISYEDLITIEKQKSNFDKIYRILVENNYVSLRKIVLQNRSSTAEER
jgi:hypothetical protein